MLETMSTIQFAIVYSCPYWGLKTHRRVFSCWWMVYRCVKPEVISVVCNTKIDTLHCSCYTSVYLSITPIKIVTKTKFKLYSNCTYNMSVVVLRAIVVPEKWVESSERRCVLHITETKVPPSAG